MKELKRKKINLKIKFEKIFKKINFYLFYIRHHPIAIIKIPYFFITLGPKGFFEKIKKRENYLKYFDSFNYFSKIINFFIFLFSPQKIIKGLKILFTQGPKAVIDKIKEKITQDYHQLSINQQYQIWLKKNYPTRKDLKKQKIESKKFKYKPLISILTPVYNTNPVWLNKCVESVIKQTYHKWELCLINDGSTNYKTVKAIEELKKKDPRIKIKILKKNLGISLASQEGLLMAKGDYIGLLDSDDELAPNALYEVVKFINNNLNADFIYSDEDKIDKKNKLYDPFFKPDWSYNLLLSIMYTCHFTVYKKKLVQKVEGFDNKYRGSQDYDLALKISEITKNIYHIPKILYHWRSLPTSAAFKGDIKGYPILNAKKAIEDHLKRKGIEAKVLDGVGIGRWRIKYKIKNYPKVTIILLTGGKLDLLSQCLRSVLKKSTYKNYEILIVDNSLNQSIRLYLKKLKKIYKNKIKFYSDNSKPFNFSKLCNNAIKKVKSPYIILLNDDTKVITPNWIESMMEHGQKEEVGIVGCKLLYLDNRIQHAGVAFGIYGNSGHCFKGIKNESHYYFDFPHVVREVSAVTFACAMIKTDIYKQLNGLDENNLKVAFNDTDFCLKVRKKGYLIIYTPYAVLYHLESVTKPVHWLKGEAEYIKKKWKDIIKYDPYYNPNLTIKKEDYSLRI